MPTTAGTASADPAVTTVADPPDRAIEAALTKLMVLADHHEADDVRRLTLENLAGELNTSSP
jgi:hypothetical protein